MSKKAIIFDLDNTIYSVHSIGKELFASLFELIFENGKNSDNEEKIKADIMCRPFQFVANDYHFDEELKQRGIELLQNASFEGKIEPFSDYEYVKNLQVDKFLVTTGFIKLQQSKITGMKLENDFKEIYIIDPLTSGKTKKDVFADIMKRHSYNKSELLVVGDDINSEIKAAQELGIDTVLYDKFHLHNNDTSLNKISDFRQLNSFL